MQHAKTHHIFNLFIMHASTCICSMHDDRHMHAYASYMPSLLPDLIVLQHVICVI